MGKTVWHLEGSIRHNAGHGSAIYTYGQLLCCLSFTLQAILTNQINSLDSADREEGSADDERGAGFCHIAAGNEERVGGGCSRWDPQEEDAGAD